MASLFKKTMVYLGLVDDDYDDYGGYEEPAHAPVHQPPAPPVRRVSPAAVEPESGSVRTLRDPSSEQPSGVTVQPRTAVVRPISAPQSQRVHVVEPDGFGDAQEIGDRFKGGQPVIVNLAGADGELRRRLIDFCSGATYVLDGKMQQVSKGVYLLTPTDVEVSAEDKRRLQERGLYRS